MVSRLSGLSTMRAVIASTSILSHVTSGYSRATSASHLVPDHHAVTLRVRLRHDGQELARPRAGQVERKAQDALDARAGEDRNVGRNFNRSEPRCDAPAVTPNIRPPNSRA